MDGLAGGLMSWAYMVVLVESEASSDPVVTAAAHRRLSNVLRVGIGFLIFAAALLLA